MELRVDSISSLPVYEVCLCFGFKSELSSAYKKKVSWPQFFLVIIKKVCQPFGSIRIKLSLVWVDNRFITRQCVQLNSKKHNYISIEVLWICFEVSTFVASQCLVYLILSLYMYCFQATNIRFIKEMIGGMELLQPQFLSWSAC